jgi:hypothetical protein
MHNNWFNIGNNLPAGYSDNGQRLDDIGLSGRYHRNIQKWEKANEKELTELENAVKIYYRHPDHVYDAEFCKRFEELKTKFPAQSNYLLKKHF